MAPFCFPPAACSLVPQLQPSRPFWPASSKFSKGLLPAVASAWKIFPAGPCLLCLNAPFPPNLKYSLPCVFFQLLKTYFFNHLIVFIASLLLWTVGCKWAGTHGWSVHWFIHSPDIMLSRQRLLHSRFPNDWIRLWGGIINILFKMLCLWYVE